MSRGGGSLIRIPDLHSFECLNETNGSGRERPRGDGSKLSCSRNAAHILIFGERDTSAGEKTE